MNDVVVPEVYSNGFYPAIAVWTSGLVVDFIPLYSAGLSVYRLHVRGFAATFKPLSVRSVQDAAKDFLKVGRMTEGARAALERIAAGINPVAGSGDTPHEEQDMAKMATQEKPVKGAKKVSEAGAAGPGRRPAFQDTDKIVVLATENPYKKEARAAEFAKYRKANTVAKYLAAGGKRADLNWDAKQGHIQVG